MMKFRELIERSVWSRSTISARENYVAMSSISDVKKQTLRSLVNWNHSNCHEPASDLLSEPGHHL